MKQPVVIQGLNVPRGGETAVAIAWTNTITPDCVVEMLCTTEHGDIGGVGCVALDLAGIAKLREALDKAEAAWKARIAPPPVVKTAQEAYAIVGAGNELVAMAVQAGTFRAPQIDVVDAPKSIGDRIRWARRKAKLTLEDTANVMGCSIPRASDVERHNAQPTEAEIAALAKLFGMEPKELTG